jgi:hypothetical protein
MMQNGIGFVQNGPASGIVRANRLEHDVAGDFGDWFAFD